MEMETPEHKTLNNALVTTNEVLSITWKFSVNHAPSHTIGKSAGQNIGRNEEERRQDLQRVDIDVPPTKLQKDQPQC